MPPEGHCSAISIEKKEMRIFVYGGHYPESTHKTNETNSIIILKFKLENRIVFQGKVKVKSKVPMCIQVVSFGLSHRLQTAHGGLICPQCHTRI